jgi:hypothetical protein
VSGIQNAMAIMGYAAGVSGPEACRNCAHGQARATGLRCTKGGFYVVPSGSCNKFEQAPASDERVQIGPLDIT